jgi:hypothetical protein
MKGLLGIATALMLTALGHAVASHYWRPLLPWTTSALDAAWWNSPVSWVARALLIVAVVALLIVAVWALCDDVPTKSGIVATLGFVSIPYTASVVLYVLISGPIQAGPEGVTAAEEPASLTSPRAGSPPAIELTVTSVADAEAGLSRVRDHLRSTLTPALARLSSDVDDIRARLHATGVRRSADLKDNARGRALAQELAEAIRYRDAVAKSIELHKNAEFELDSLLRRLRRAELVAGTGLPEGEFLRMNQTLRLLDGQLAERAGQPKELSDTTELDSLIDRELASTQAETPPVTAASR